MADPDWDSEFTAYKTNRKHRGVPGLASPTGAANSGAAFFSPRSTVTSTPNSPPPANTTINPISTPVSPTTTSSNSSPPHRFTQFSTTSTTATANTVAPTPPTKPASISVPVNAANNISNPIPVVAHRKSIDETNNSSSTEDNSISNAGSGSHNNNENPIRVVVTNGKSMRKGTGTGISPNLMSPTSSGTSPLDENNSADFTSKDENNNEEDIDNSDDETNNLKSPVGYVSRSAEEEKRELEADIAASWVKFIDPKTNTKLYFNISTSQVQLNTAPIGFIEGTLNSLDDEEDDMSNISLGISTTKSGTISQYSLEEKGNNIINNNRRSSGGGKSDIIDNSGRDIFGDDYTVLNSMSVERVIKSLQVMEKQIEFILNKGMGLQSNNIQDLKNIKLKFNNMANDLASAELKVDERNDVEALIEYNKIAWDFNNYSVDYFRAAASRINHQAMEYKDWHQPSYFSTFPLPPGIKTVTAMIALPHQENALMTHTRINITEKDSVNHCIHLSMAKVKGLGDESQYVLKAVGSLDYMYGERPLFDYEYIRQSIRDGEELSLKLVKRPQSLPLLPDHTLLSDAYKSKVKPNIAILNKEDLRDVSSKVSWDKMRMAPLAEMDKIPFRLRITAVDNVTEESMPKTEGCSNIFVRTFLYHGLNRIPDTCWETNTIPLSNAPRFGQWFVSKETMLGNIPRNARIAFLLLTKLNSTEVILGWVSKQLINEQGELITGKQQLKLWNFPAKRKGKHSKHRDVDPNFVFRAPVGENLSDRVVATLHVQFDSFAVPLVSPMTEKYREPRINIVGPEIPLKTLTKPQSKQLEDLLEQDSLYELTPEDKALIWMARHSLVKYPQMLPKFLLCVNWGLPDHKFEAHRLLKLWSPPLSALAAIELLDAKYPDYVVREHAVTILRRLTDDELRLYLLQFTQCLKYEPYHESSLTRFLIERAIKSPFIIGHTFFWHLKAELHNPGTCERFALILEEFLSHCGRFTLELRKQLSAVQHMQRMAELVHRLKKDYNDIDVMKEYHKELEKLNKDFFGPMGKFQIPLNPKIEATTLIIEKCRYMSSKMVPLWLVFKNADEDAPPIYIIFKSGDDLRQDILTLQLLQIMDKIWLSAGLDLRMKPYKCIATGINDHGDGVGMIEVVMNSDTTSGIQLKYGGGAMGALKLDPIDLFLKDNNKGKLYDTAVDNFVYSCAGYCVATFVLGIGDRHNGNIMVTKDGHLFHIDFGHFLGNFKQKFGVNRERAAFVFTPEMAFVMGGKKYKNSAQFNNFLTHSKKAFKALRSNANILEMLFLLMVSAGMPELMIESDIYYMREKLYIGEKEARADKKLQAEIEKSLDSTYRRIDNWIHNMKHGK